MKLTSESLATHLEERLLPAYLISGDEPLLAGEAADAVRARARSAGFTEREVHFIERAADWDALRGSAASLSLFGSRRIIEVRLASARPALPATTRLLRCCKAPDPDTLLLILTPRLDRDAQGAEWVRALDKHGGWVPVWPVDAAADCPGGCVPARDACSWRRTRRRSSSWRCAPRAICSRRTRSSPS